MNLSQRMQLLEEALALGVTEREHWLAGLQLSPDVRRWLDELLQAGLHANTLLDTAIMRSVLPNAKLDLDSQLGPYRVLEKIGSGGMGDVYLAERADGEYQAQVAIKVLGRAHPSLQAQFQNERQILADLDHPNIARLLDAGTTPAQLPYVVMEYVQGEHLLDYVATHNLSQKMRLSLFLAVCAGVQAAHSALVIHRDLKPANILVSPSGVPKVLDFGIAEVIQPIDSVTTDAVSVQAMTPTYASPEQRNGERLGTTTDVYSLGLLLAELLSDDLGPDRDTTGLDPQLKAVVARATAKTTDQRYVNAGELSNDILRFLEQQPVQAFNGGATYRLHCFVKRNKALSGALALAFLALGVGVGVASWQARQAAAERDQATLRFDQTRTLVQYLLDDLHRGLDSVAGASEIRRDIADKANHYLRSLVETRPGDAQLLLETAQGFRQLGDMQGSPREQSLGLYQAAQKSYQQGATILSQAQVVAKPDLVSAIQLELGQNLLAQAHLAFHDATDAVIWSNFGERAESILAPLAQDGDNYEEWRARLEARVFLADAAVFQENYEKAQLYINRVVADASRSFENWNAPQQQAWQVNLARALATSADLEFYSGNFDASLQRAKLMTQQVDAGIAERPNNANLKRGAWLARQKQAQALAGLSRWQEAILVLTQALSIAQELAADDPQDYAAGQMQAEALGLRAVAYAESSQRSLAHASLAESSRLWEQLASQRPNDRRPLALLLQFRRQQAQVYETLGQPSQACETWQQLGQALAQMQDQHGLTPQEQETLAAAQQAGTARCANT